MSSDIEGAGNLAAATLVGAALDRTGEPYDPAREGGAGYCLNCGATLVGRYCVSCGQPARVHRTIHGMVEELFHNLIHLDARVWRTLPLLVFRPGRLTREYVHGKRSTYVSPLALFLFIVFAMFFVFGMAGGPRFGVPDEDQATSAGEAIFGGATEGTELEGVIVSGDGETEDAAGAAGEAPADAPSGDGVEETGEEPDEAAGAEAGDQSETQDSIAEIEEGLSELSSLQLSAVEMAIRAAVAEGDLSDDDEAALRDVLANIDARQEGSGGGGFLDSLSQAAESGEMDINTGSRVLDARLRHSFANPELTLYRLQDAAYKYCFLLVPISLPFMWLIFAWKRGVTLFDHCVFVLYSLSFMALLFLSLALLRMVGMMGAVMPFAFLATPVHLACQLKGAYGLRWFSAIWRTFFVLTAAFFALLIYFLAIIALGLLG